MTLTLRRAGLAAAVLAVLGLVVLLGGLLPFKASTGHWHVTETVLTFAMGRSIWTWSRGTPIPYDLHDDELRPLGAGMYDDNCAVCHGRPGERPVLAEQMLPPAPDLTEPSRLDARGQYYVVLHGLRLTAMPAWPSQERGDEVAAVVSFLQVLPELDADGYRRLVQGVEEEEGCGGCHDRGLVGVPVLDGQPAAYLAASLRAYRDGERPSGAMEPLTRGMDDARIDGIASHFADRPLPGSGPVTHALVDDGIPARRIPPCGDCHGEDHPEHPRLVGQDPTYLARQLHLFQEGTRGGGPYRELMEVAMAHGLTDEEIEAVATAYAGRPPQPTPTVGH